MKQVYVEGKYLDLIESLLDVVDEEKFRAKSITKVKKLFYRDRFILQIKTAPSMFSWGETITIKLKKADIDDNTSTYVIEIKSEMEQMITWGINRRNEKDYKRFMEDRIDNMEVRR